MIWLLRNSFFDNLQQWCDGNTNIDGIENSLSISYSKGEESYNQKGENVEKREKPVESRDSDKVPT